MFALQNAPAAALELAGVTWLPRDISTDASPSST